MISSSSKVLGFPARQFKVVSEFRDVGFHSSFHSRSSKIHRFGLFGLGALRGLCVVEYRTQDKHL